MTQGTNGVDRADAGEMAVAVARLATLSPLEYDQQRRAEAERLGVRASVLDKEVQKAREEMEPAAARAGRSVALTEPEPWEEPVELGGLLDDMVAAVLRHVVLPVPPADVVALWIAHTWAFERFQHTPRLGITSPVRRCGKSTLMDLLRALCRRTLKADSISPSAVFRTVEALHPVTLLIDEADTFLKDNEELRGVLNSGFEASGSVLRVVEREGQHEPVQFATFAPVALAAIGKLPETLADRAVPIALQRKAVHERTAKMRLPTSRRALEELARRLKRWGEDDGRHLTGEPEIPEALNDRQGDIAVPLLAIADRAGGAWAVRARASLVEVFGAGDAADAGLETGALLLSDIRAILSGRGHSGRMHTAQLLPFLHDLDRPWAEWSRGKVMTAYQLGKALAPFGVHSKTLRIGEERAKGYELADFSVAFSRYLPAPPPETGVESRDAVTTEDALGL